MSELLLRQLRAPLSTSCHAALELLRPLRFHLAGVAMETVVCKHHATFAFGIYVLVCLQILFCNFRSPECGQDTGTKLRRSWMRSGGIQSRALWWVLRSKTTREKLCH